MFSHFEWGEQLLGRKKKKKGMGPKISPPRSAHYFLSMNAARACSRNFEMELCTLE